MYRRFVMYASQNKEIALAILESVLSKDNRDHENFSAIRDYEFKIILLRNLLFHLS